jgi:hypothetical protein
MEIAAAVTVFLAPYLRQLLEPVAEEAGKRLNETAWKHAKALWGRLRPAVESKPAVKEAVEDVARTPEDEDALAALRHHLRKLLEQDQDLARDLGRLWEQAEADNVTVTVTASGERSVAVGGDVSGSTIVSGDQNIIDR